MIRIVALSALLLLAPAGVSSATDDPGAPLLGKWRTQEQGGVVELHRCGAAICGRVLDGLPLRADPDQRDVRNKKAALRGRKVMGLRVIEGFTGGPKEWTGGPIYDPDTGDGAAKGVITLVSRDVIKLKGCLGPICRTQTWTRLK